MVEFSVFIPPTEKTILTTTHGLEYLCGSPDHWRVLNTPPEQQQQQLKNRHIEEGKKDNITLPALFFPHGNKAQPVKIPQSPISLLGK